MDVIGLGAGTVAAYADKNDKMTFYEIDPKMYETAKSDFTYFEYIEDIATSEVCKKVKLAELEDNQDIVRVNKLSFKTYSIEARCKKVREILSR